MVTLSVIVPTGGKRVAGLIQALSSILPQLESGDEVIITRLDCNWGHRARNLAMPRAAGTHLMFLDDDDEYTENALSIVRAQLELEPDRVHIFAMRHDNVTYIANDPVHVGGVGTPMIVVPNTTLGSWGDVDYEGDWHFLSSTLRLREDRPICHEDVIALIRPHA